MKASRRRASGDHRKRRRAAPRGLAALGAGALALAATGCTSAGFGLLNLGGVARAQTHRFDARADLSLDVHRPAECPAGGCAAVVFFYGGSWRSGSRAQYAFAGKRFAAMGYVGIVADYRLYPAVRFPTFAEDAASAVAWTLANARELDVDPERVFVAGHSAGAHLAAMVGTQARFLRAHGRSPRELAGVIGLAGPYDFLPMGEAIAPAFGDVAQDPVTQPITHVDGDEPPFLLLHGEADRTVWPRNSARLAQRLRARGVPVVHRTYPGVGHVRILGALRVQRLAPVVRDVREFVEGESRR